ncbi:MAG TPA: hypothetical protein VF158_14455 [Longimicrobiales bacterium]
MPPDTLRAFGVVVAVIVGLCFIVELYDRAEHELRARFIRRNRLRRRR